MQFWNSLKVTNNIEMLLPTKEQKQPFLENSHENTYVRDFFVTKLQANTSGGCFRKETNVNFFVNNKSL